jgi:hypothetical protein
LGVGKHTMRGLMVASALWALPALAGTVLEPGVRVTAEERYDDGMLLPSGPAAGEGQLMTKVSPRLSLQARNRNLESEVAYEPDLMVRHGSGAVSFDHKGSVKVDQELSRRLEVGGELAVWRVSDPTSLPRLGMARSLTPVLYGKGEVNGVGRVTERTMLRAGYRFEGVQLIELGTPPGFAHAPYAEGYYSVTPRTLLGAEARLQLFAFGLEQAMGQSAVAAYRYRLSRLSLFELKAGATRFVRLSPGTEEGWVPRVNLAL